MSNAKKFDKTTIIVVAVCIVLLFGWNYIFGPKGLNWLPQPEPQQQEKVVEKTTDVKAEKETAVKAVQKTDETTVAENKTSKNATVPEKKVSQLSLSMEQWKNKYPDVKVDSPDSLMTMEIDPVKGAVDSIKLNKITDSNRKNDIVLAQKMDPEALTVYQPKDDWKLTNVEPPVQKDNSVTVTRQFKNESGQLFTITQNWELQKTYQTKYTVSIRNDSSSVLNMRELYFCVGAIAPAPYLSGDHPMMEYHGIDALLSNSKTLYTVKAGSSTFLNDPIQFEPVKWISVSDAYFAYILKAAGKGDIINGGNYIYTKNETADVKGDKKSYDKIGSAAREQGVVVQPNKTQTWNFDYYTGPKDMHQLKAFAYKAEDTLHLMTWPIMRTLAAWFLYALIWLKGICGSFGLAIILLTIIVKIIFWPLTHKSNMSMKRMQKIQPMVKELRDKYKDDKQKLNQATMELYKKEKVNPLGGCLPMLIQIPVLIALYYTLYGAFEIRQASFLWATDLTKPDTIGHIFGIAINPFAILMAITMLAQQKMTPTATDPAQAKMMMLMPIIMLFFLYNLPSGLTMYWTVSQVITIIQLLYNKYFSKDEDDKKRAKTQKQKKAKA